MATIQLHISYFIRSLSYVLEFDCLCEDYPGHEVVLAMTFYADNCAFLILNCGRALRRSALDSHKQSSSTSPQKTPIRHECQLLVALLDPNNSSPTPAMRYDDWDVILFPKDSHVPIQEFKTACYVSPEECEYHGLRHPLARVFQKSPASVLTSMQMVASCLL